MNTKEQIKIMGGTIENMLEEASDEFLRNHEIENMRALRKTLDNSINLLDSFIEDIEIGLAFFRGRMLKVLLEEFDECRFLTSFEDTGKVSFGFYDENKTEGAFENFKNRLSKEIKLEPTKLYTGLNINVYTLTITWTWVK